MKKFSKEEIILIHQFLVEQYGGDDNIRDQELLDLSINSPYQTFDGEYLYEGIVKKAVHLCYSLVMNHPFVDGNKRIGAHCLVILLDANNYPLDYNQEELIDVIMGIASSKLSEDDLLIWVENHIKKSGFNWKLKSDFFVF